MEGEDSMTMKMLRRGGLVCALAVLFLARGTSARAASFQRGDVDVNGALDITDAINILNYLFLGGAGPSCLPLANVDGEGGVDLTDPISLLTNLFLGGPAPPALRQDEIVECKGLDPQAVLRGKKIYETDDLAKNPRATPFACGTCHRIIPDDPSGMMMPGHSLHDALRRPTFKFGKLQKFIDASNVCRKDWMTTTTYSENDQDYKDLVVFMESVSPNDPVPALNYEIECSPSEGPAGDGTAGCALFDRTCSVCHGGGALTPPLSVSLLNLRVQALDDPDYIRTRIRKSGPSTFDNPDVVYPCLIGATTMPFWTRDRLSDQQVEDLVAFIALARQAVRDGKPTFDCSDPVSADGKVLRRGTLVTRQHLVSGTAEELDTRRIKLSNFSYDGAGALVKVWLYKQGDIQNGHPIGPDFVGNFYDRETLVVEIPSEITSDMYDSVSIYDVPFAISFGDCALSAVP